MAALSNRAFSEGVFPIRVDDRCWLIGQVLVAFTGRRTAPILVLYLSALAAVGSLPWFVGQITPDLFTALMAMTPYLLQQPIERRSQEHV